MNFAIAQTILVGAGVQFDTGLTDEEFARIEGTFGFEFPPDLREFLSLGLPKSDSWVDWRRADENAIRERLKWPFEGICFDIEHNVFWLEGWGIKPDELKTAFEIAY
ncbi:MAG TPA: hypothetical protein VGN88_09515 [Phycisphaerae bacterium]